MTCKDKNNTALKLKIGNKSLSNEAGVGGGEGFL